MCLVLIMMGFILAFKVDKCSRFADLLALGGVRDQSGVTFQY